MNAFSNAFSRPGFVIALSLLPLAAKADMPSSIAAPDEVVVATVHAEGAQVYECRTDATGTFAWQFREPIATLMLDGKTVGRHFAGPVWELSDGSAVSAKVSGRAPGMTAKDIPLLKLAAIARDEGQLAAVSTIQRLNTRGGALEGACEQPGLLASVPYSADYVFLQKKP